MTTSSAEISWIVDDGRLIEIGGMWLAPGAIWAVRADHIDADFCIVTGHSGVELRLGLSAAAAVDVLNASVRS